jgi:PIN domain nuclease of toxin-antitoxin system
MKYLLDTHTFFWSATNVQKLPKSVQGLIADEVNFVGVSIASFWEMAIKASLGKWDLPYSLSDFRKFANTEDIKIVSISVEITEIVRTLPLHHGDPFDRIIIATALEESWTLLSVDHVMDNYTDLQRIW